MTNFPSVDMHDQYKYLPYVYKYKYFITIVKAARFSTTKHYIKGEIYI